MNRTDALFNKIFTSVAAVHGVMILLCCITIFVSPKPRAPLGRKIKVQTIDLSEALAMSQINVVAQASGSSLESKPKDDMQVKIESKPAVIPEPKINPPAKTQPEVKKSPPKPELKQPEAAQKPQLKQPAKPSNATKTPPAVQNEIKQKIDAERQKLLSKAKESLNQMKAVSAKVPTNLIASHSKPIEKLQSEVYADADSLFGSERNGNYRDELVAILKRRLKLPTYGNVTIELTLLRSGKIKAFKVLKDENSENRKQVEKMIPALSFPGFGSAYENEAQHSFTITLTNDL